MAVCILQFGFPEPAIDKETILKLALNERGMHEIAIFEFRIGNRASDDLARRQIRRAKMYIGQP